VKRFPYTVAGERTMTHVPETSRDLDAFRAWVERKTQSGETVGADTETTGLDIFSPTYGLRTVQLGDAHDAWVLQVEGRPEMQEAARRALLTVKRLVFHNATFDLLVLDRHLRAPFTALAPKTTDSKIIAHLFDPRPKHEGGYGLR
jgi:DNA polymerase-1